MISIHLRAPLLLGSALQCCFLPSPDLSPARSLLWCLCTDAAQVTSSRNTTSVCEESSKMGWIMKQKVVSAREVCFGVMVYGLGAYSIEMLT